MNPSPSPTYLTHAVPGTGGVIKQRPEDFLVEEIPAYEPVGSGEHIYLLVEKRNLTTMDLVRIVARHFDVRRDAVGFAGLKDRFAVTRQVISVHTPGKSPEDFPALAHPDVTVHWVDRHTNKLRRGHLIGNRFVIRVRNAPVGKVVHALRSLRTLAELGAPNRVGEQRFGVLGQNHVIGRALLMRDAKAVADTLLGMPPEGFWCPPSQVDARQLYARGKFREAIEAAPRGMRSERAALEVLARGGTPAGVVRSLERFEQSFFVAALQSHLFNLALDARLATSSIATLTAGDLAFKHDSGGVFAITPELIDDPDQSTRLRERLSALEISPSGPMWGTGMMHAGGDVAQRELKLLDDAGLSLEMFARLAKSRIDGVEGARRPFRVPLTHTDVEAGQDEHGPYIRCTFELPRGSFATSVMREIIKPEAGQTIMGSREPEDDDQAGQQAG